MSEELKTAIYTAVEISVFALLVFIIGFFGGFAKDALNIKKSQDVSISEITEYRDLYEIDKGKRIDITTKGLSNSVYLNIKKGYRNDEGLNMSVNNYRNWLNENDSNIIKGEDLLNYISKKGGNYDIYIYFGTKINTVFKVTSSFTYGDLLKKYNLGSENSKYNDVFILPSSGMVRITPEGQNQNLVYFLREQMGMYITSDFYCSSIFDSTDNTYMAIVFKMIE